MVDGQLRLMSRQGRLMLGQERLMLGQVPFTVGYGRLLPRHRRFSGPELLLRRVQRKRN